MQHHSFLSRRSLIAGSLASAGLLSLPGCATLGGGLNLTEAVRRLLVLSSERAFDRMTAQGGFWDEQVAQLGLDRFLGTRGDVLSSILTSALFKSRMEGVVSSLAVEASHRAAPVVTDAVRTVGIRNAVALIRGGPNAATTFLRREMDVRLIEAMVPELGDALAVAEDPLVSELIAGLTGMDAGGLAQNLAREMDELIWQAIGAEEAAIRNDPAQSGDPLLTGVLEAESAL